MLGAQGRQTTNAYERTNSPKGFSLLSGGKLDGFELETFDDRGYEEHPTDPFAVAIVEFGQMRSCTCTCDYLWLM